MRYRFTDRARADLRDIGAYTLAKWGADQCGLYLEGLKIACQHLADDPNLGRACDHIRPGLFRREVVRHVVFYRALPDGIRVVAILHDRMLPELHLTTDEDEDEDEDEE